jgi:hypothetical protein
MSISIIERKKAVGGLLVLLKSSQGRATGDDLAWSLVMGSAGAIVHIAYSI